MEIIGENVGVGRSVVSMVLETEVESDEEDDATGHRLFRNSGGVPR